MFLKNRMPKFNVVIKCKTRDNQDAAILPQSCFLVYKGEVYNIISHWDYCIRNMVDIFNYGYKFVIRFTFKDTLFINGTISKTIDSFNVNIRHPVYPHEFAFKGTCYLDYGGRAGEAHRMLGYTHMGGIHDNRMFHWVCIMRFLRKQVFSRLVKRRVAVAMGMHCRLGERSILRVLDDDLLTRLF